MTHPILFLFDIDGTLLHAGTQVHRESFAHAYRTVYGLPLSLEGIPAGGRTDTWLLAEPLRRHGLEENIIWGKMPDAFASMQEYVEQHLGDLRDRVLPGVRELLSTLHDRGYVLGLLTGNLSRIASAKMCHAGLAHFFDIGGYGEESEVRAHLVAVALSHACTRIGRPISPRHAVVIGDTPLDIEAGRAHGTRTVAVATGPVSEEALRDAQPDLLLQSFADHVRSAQALERLVRDDAEHHGGLEHVDGSCPPLSVEPSADN